MIGISFKVSYDGKYIAIATPLDPPSKWLSGNQVLQIVIIDTQNRKNTHIAISTRHGFRGFYWEQHSNNLWLDGDYGIVCYKAINESWEEYVLIKAGNDENLLVNGKSTETIDISQVPNKVKSRLKPDNNSG